MHGYIGLLQFLGAVGLEMSRIDWEYCQGMTSLVEVMEQRLHYCMNLAF